MWAFLLFGTLGCSSTAEDLCDRYDECSLSYEDETNVDQCVSLIEGDLSKFEAEFGEDALDDLESALGTCPDEESCERFHTCTRGVIASAVIANCPDWPSCEGLLD